MQNLELLYLAVAYSMGGILFRLNKTKKHLTVSEVGASSKIGRNVFFWGLLGSGLLFALLMFSWFIPHYDLPALYKILVIILVSFQLLTGVIPARGKKLNFAHIVMAFSLASSMFIFILALTLTNTISTLARVGDSILALVMIMQIILSKNKSSAGYMHRQQVFFACWHLAIFITVYFG